MFLTSGTITLLSFSFAFNVQLSFSLIFSLVLFSTYFHPFFPLRPLRYRRIFTFLYFVICLSKLCIILLHFLLIIPLQCSYHIDIIIFFNEEEFLEFVCVGRIWGSFLYNVLSYWCYFFSIRRNSWNLFVLVEFEWA